MSKSIPAKERDAIFPFMVQRRNPATKRWLNVSSQPKESDAEMIKKYIEDAGHEVRVIRK